MTHDEVYKHLITKQLEKHGIDFDKVVSNQIIDGVEWYQYYTMTNEEHDEFKKYSIKYIAKNLRGYNKRNAEKVFRSFDLMYGLKVV